MYTFISPWTLLLGSYCYHQLLDKSQVLLSFPPLLRSDVSFPSSSFILENTSESSSLAYQFENEPWLIQQLWVQTETFPESMVDVDIAVFRCTSDIARLFTR